MVHIVNYYTGGATLLDAACSLSSNGGYIVESTGTHFWDANFKSSSWQIKFSDETKTEGDIIRDGDMVHLINQFGVKSYLDANGPARCSQLYGTPNIFEVETTPNLNRDKAIKSSTWQIVLKDDSGNFHTFLGLQVKIMTFDFKYLLHRFDEKIVGLKFIIYHLSISFALLGHIIIMLTPNLVK